MMRKMTALLVVLALMVAIPCLMPFNGFEHTANEATAVETMSVHAYAKSNANDVNVAIAFAMAAVAAGAAFLGEERKNYDFA